jgi:hypothetical protein
MLGGGRWEGRYWAVDSPSPITPCRAFKTQNTRTGEKMHSCRSYALHVGYLLSCTPAFLCMAFFRGKTSISLAFRNHYGAFRTGSLGKSVANRISGSPR